MTSPNIHPHVSILRLPAVLRLCGKSRTAWYVDVASGLAPRPVSLGSRSVGWPDIEILALNGARIAGKSDADLRHLVKQLHAARSAGAAQ